MKKPAIFVLAPFLALALAAPAAISSETPDSDSASPAISAEGVTEEASEPIVAPQPEPELTFFEKLFGKTRGTSEPATLAPAAAAEPQKKSFLARLFGDREEPASSARVEIASIGEANGALTTETTPAISSEEAPTPLPAAAPEPARRGGFVTELLGGLESIGEEQAPVVSSRDDNTVEAASASAPEDSLGRFARLFKQGKDRRTQATEQRSERKVMLGRLAHAFAQERTNNLRIVRTTAYTHTEADHREWGRQTATGSQLQAHRRYNSAAADWSVYPPGTKFRITGDPTVYVVDDYGRALVGTGTIDIYKPSRAAMNTWGVRNVQIEIVEEGSYNEARTILQERLHHAHCKQMYRAIQPKPWT